LEFGWLVTTPPVRFHIVNQRRKSGQRWIVCARSPTMATMHLGPLQSRPLWQQFLSARWKESALNPSRPQPRPRGRTRAPGQTAEPKRWQKLGSARQARITTVSTLRKAGVRRKRASPLATNPRQHFSACPSFNNRRRDFQASYGPFSQTRYRWLRPIATWSKS
jgi:hypothetical protein